MFLVLFFFYARKKTFSRLANNRGHPPAGLGEIRRVDDTGAAEGDDLERRAGSARGACRIGPGARAARGASGDAQGGVRAIDAWSAGRAIDHICACNTVERATR